MSAARAARRPSFSTYTEVDVEISAEDLEADGWVYVGDAASAPGFPAVTPLPLNAATDAVRDWHDRTHPTAWPWCAEEPCRDVR